MRIPSLPSLWNFLRNKRSVYSSISLSSQTYVFKVLVYFIEAYLLAFHDDIAREAPRDIELNLIKLPGLESLMNNYCPENLFHFPFYSFSFFIVIIIIIIPFATLPGQRFDNSNVNPVVNRVSNEFSILRFLDQRDNYSVCETHLF